MKSEHVQPAVMHVACANEAKADGFYEVAP